MMIKNLLLIAVSASLTAIFETVLYTFLAFNTFDKTLDNPLSVPFLVMIAYYFSILLMSLGEWIRCFKHSEYLERKTRLCGAVTNFFILAGVLVLIVVGSLADNNLILQDWPPIFKNFSLYVIAGFAIGTT